MKRIFNNNFLLVRIQVKFTSKNLIQFDESFLDELI